MLKRLNQLILSLPIVLAFGVDSHAVNVCGFTDAWDFSGMRLLPFGGETIGIGPAGGEVVGTTLNVTFTTTGTFNARDLGIFLNLPTNGGSAWGFTGAQLGWNGQGTFTAQLSSDALNGLLDSYGNPWSTWFLDTVNLNPGGGPITGTLDELVFRITWGPCPIGDVTHDWNVNIDDLVQVITNWGACPAQPQECPADATGDQQVNIDDLVAVITHWGSYCPNCQ